MGISFSKRAGFLQFARGIEGGNWGEPLLPGFIRLYDLTKGQGRRRSILTSGAFLFLPAMNISPYPPRHLFQAGKKNLIRFSFPMILIPENKSETF
jgi:hypothetical protein